MPISIMLHTSAVSEKKPLVVIQKCSQKMSRKVFRHRVPTEAPRGRGAPPVSQASEIHIFDLLQPLTLNINHIYSRLIQEFCVDVLTHCAHPDSAKAALTIIIWGAISPPAV